MKLACVIHRFGADIAGGAESHCLAVAERLAERHAVTVLTTCAKNHITWQNEYPAGVSQLGPIQVHRFPVARTRSLHRFAEIRFRVALPRALDPVEDEIDGLDRIQTIPELDDLLDQRCFGLRDFGPIAVVDLRSAELLREDLLGFDRHRHDLARRAIAGGLVLDDQPSDRVRRRVCHREELGDIREAQITLHAVRDDDRDHQSKRESDAEMAKCLSAGRDHDRARPESHERKGPEEFGQICLTFHGWRSE